ncbi:MAG: hypothetical protein IKW96_12665 [Ruminococcus sp.]|uniref:hypothetical protein n=1 Tax=Ruminococcus sp. TaxID=41978 RepID=UPI0025D690C3|nr:hypothetical protein [Ruminococcus sp.]MBR5684103.1 hypothetical protein [Ruminococcus sp.]
MKRLLTLSAVIAMAVSLCACGSKKNSTSNLESNDSAAVSQKLSPADQLLEDVKGTYDELFTVICDPKYDQVWLDNCEKFVGKDMAESTAEMLKNSCTGTYQPDENTFIKLYENTLNFPCTNNAA